MAMRFAFVLAGCALIGSLSGCCCSHLGGYKGGCSPCQSPCGAGGCPPAFYPPTGTSSYPGYGATAYGGDPGLATAYSPTTYTTTTMLPTQALPTY